MSDAKRPRYAFVIHHYGESRFGGASSLAARLAQRFGDWSDVEVLTTCAEDYMTWENVLPEGYSRLDGVFCRRFPVDHPRNVRRFEQLSRRLFAESRPSIEDQEAWMRAQGPMSRQLFEYLETFGKRYDAFLFFGYLYANAYFGLPLVEERAFLIPLAHDEWPMRLSIWDAFFTRPRGFFFNTPEEEAFLRARFPDLPLPGSLAGLGIDPPLDADPNRFRRAFGLQQPFLLYLGRIDPSKGCEHLLDDFAQYREAGGRYRDLAMIGEAHMRVPRREGVHWVGGVDEQLKWDALAACDVVVVPSRYESLSLTALEAWCMGKPVLANAHAASVVGQCRRAQGGLWYANADELAVALDILDDGLREQLGSQGRSFVAAHYRWDPVLDTYRAALR